MNNLGLHAPNSQLISVGADVVHLSGPYVKFHVDLNLPDAFILAEFQKFIQTAREYVPAPVLKSGPAARNGRFDEVTFSKWKNLRIVEFCELLAWRNGQPPEMRKHLKDAVLGRWIKRNLPKDVGVTRNALKNALARLPALGSQTHHEKGWSESVDRAVRRRIVRDIGQTEALPQIRRIMGYDT